ncbi:DUF805 domain-containing protein [Hyphomonas sp.]|jgi:uncharacterized membrane protein YhaH (DUF805 family)|uniref:DUF805 domain-containing protein n=1 Tax=Hyphomonas sp. TaxID=87 RepID=UPI0025C6D73D|nr:DUF805 domain-containing protein [Hyphomonas sp.]
MVTFPEAIQLFFSRYVDFQGRSRRSEYWWVALFNIIVFGVGTVLAMVLGGVNFETGEMGPIGYVFIGLLGLYALGIIIPSIALFVRRLHDINQTGWIYLGLVVLGFVPLIGLLASIAQIVIACIPGTVGPNKYGPDPKNPAGSADVFV